MWDVITFVIVCEVEERLLGESNEVTGDSFGMHLSTYNVGWVNIGVVYICAYRLLGNGLFS